jgi:PhzF family phenazine biosynthesis protein
MNLPFYWVDAFTDHVFRGNPAGVVPLERWLSAELLQRIASQNHLPVTAFFVRSGPGSFELRWFTPEGELELCGHGTLAAGFAAFQLLGEPGEQLTFSTRSGAVTVRRRDGRIELDFPAQPAETALPTLELVAALGRAPRTVLQGHGRWLCIFDTRAEVAAIVPAMETLRHVLPGRIIVTAPGGDCDFVSRFFAPNLGILEDPVTGSAHCALVPYWAGRLGKTSLHARQISPRGGELWCEAAGARVRLAGEGALYLRGEISV